MIENSINLRNKFSHYRIIGEQMVPKVAFSTEKEAIKAALKMNGQFKTIHKKVAYLCHKCGKWHIGSNKTVLTDEDKKQARDKYIRNEKYNLW